MVLTVGDRLVLLHVLPREGDLISLRVIREFREDLSFSEAEQEALRFVYPGDGRVEWEGRQEPNKDVEIGQTRHGLVVQAFRKLNEQKKLRLEWLPLAERFLENGNGLAMVK